MDMQNALPNDNNDMSNTLKEMLRINSSSESPDQTNHIGAGDAIDHPSKSSEMNFSTASQASIMTGSPRDKNEAATPWQTILLQNVPDGECSQLVGNRTKIISNINTELECRTSASNKVKINTITKFEWEHRYYPGNLVSVTDLYTAYSIKGRGSYSVRVINNQNSSDRVLLKGFSGLITDIAFAHCESNTIAAIDDAGNLIVWCLEQIGGSIVPERKFHIQGEESAKANPVTHRIMWMPSVQTDNDNPVTYDSPHSEIRPPMLVLSYKSVAEVWELNMVMQYIEDTGDAVITREKVSQAFVSVDDHADEISDCELSPVGDVLATASYDGYVKFWQIDLADTQPPGCLHRFKPHDGNPVTAIRFCDNRKQSELSVFWRFLLTGCDRNVEIKLWCTVTWDCFQVIRFEPSTPAHVVPEIKFVLHSSADFLVLADIHRKVLYVIQLSSKLEEGSARMMSVAHYTLASPLLSIAFVDAKRCRFKNHAFVEENSPTRDNNDDDDDSDDETDMKDVQRADDSEKLEGVLVKLLTIQQRSLQSLDIRFLPDDSQAVDTYNTISDDLKDQVSVSSREGNLSPSDANKNDNESAALAAGDALGSPPHSPSSSLLKVDERVDVLPDSMHGSTSVKSLLDEGKFTPINTKKLRIPSEDSHVAPDVTSSTTPVLLTPDAFMGSSKSPGKFGESANTSFTAVTPFSTMGGSFYQSNPESALSDGAVKNSLSSLLSQSANDVDGENLTEEGVRTPPSSPVLPQASSSPPPPAQAPSAAAEILQSFCSRSSVKSPDLISSAAALDDVKHESPVLSAISAPPGLSRPVNVGASSSSVAPDPIDVFPSVLVPVSVVAGPPGWPKAPDVTMSRPLPAGSPANAVPMLPNPIDNPLDAFPAADVLGSLQPLVNIPVRSATDEVVIQLLKDIQQKQEEMVLSQQEKIEAITTKQNQMQKQLEASIKSSEQQGERLEKAVKTLTDNQRRLSNELKTSQTSSTDAAVSKIDRAVKAEMKKSVIPAVNSNMVQIKDALNTTVAQQLTATDSVMKETMQKVVRSKDMVDTISSSMARATHDQVRAALPEIFFQTLIPSFEKACQSMFMQLSSTYHKGMEESVKQLEKQMQFRLKPDQEKFQQLTKEASDTVAQLQSSTKQMQKEFSANIHKQVSESVEKTLLRLEDNLAAKLLSCMKQEQEEGFAQQQRVFTEIVQASVSKALDEKLPASTSEPSLAATPVVGVQVGSRPSHLQRPSIADQQQLILKMLQQGNVNTAFQTALTAADLNLVMYVCETVDPAVVFGVTPCPLQQPILLSLIQQLSSDLTTKTDIKLKYLQEAVMNLDRRHQITQEYMHSVLSALVQKLQACAQGPLENQLLVKDLKMLGMAAQSLMK